MKILQANLLFDGHTLRHDWEVIIDGTGFIVGTQGRRRHPEGAEVVCFDDHLLMPAFVNAHSHAFQRSFRGHVQWSEDPRDDFWSWRRAMYAVANTLTPEEVEAVSELAFLEMAEAGFGSVGEFHYLHHQPGGTPYDDPDELARRVVRAARRVGLRICLLRVAYGRSAPGQPLLAEQLRFGDRGPEDVLAAVERLERVCDPLTTVGLAPHSTRALPPEWLDVLASTQVVVHAHVSEQVRDNEQTLAEVGCSPTRLFADRGLLGTRFTAVHLTHPVRGDIAALEQADATVCVCPGTELDLGDGLLPIEARSLRLAVGTDSHARIDPFEEIRALEYHGRGIAGRRLVMGSEKGALAKSLVHAGTLGGARSLGLPTAAGLVPGAPADLVAVKLSEPDAWGLPPIEAVALAGRTGWVDQLIVGGRTLLTEGCHPRREAVRARALEAIRRTLP